MLSLLHSPGDRIEVADRDDAADFSGTWTASILTTRCRQHSGTNLAHHRSVSTGTSQSLAHIAVKLGSSLELTLRREAMRRQL